MLDERKPVRDRQTTTTDGRTQYNLPEGASFVPRDTLTDDRGSLWVLYDPRFLADDRPLTYTYALTCRPGKAKGWAVHKLHDDRYSHIAGEVLVVLYDGREDSPTYGLVSEVPLTPHNRGVLTIPVGVWHAMTNLGTTDAILSNAPTELYDYENPDKYRLPIDSPEIPYTFRNQFGW